MPKKALFLLLVLPYLMLFSSQATFAEGDTLCAGKVVGTTKISNVNAGQIHFNAHPGAADANKAADLSIVGLGEGFAPADKKYAACVDSRSSQSVTLGDDEYGVRGYGWNDNLGFISFYCSAGNNEGKACGAQNYGVKISKADASGNRSLSGYAWNESFGYISMSGGGAIPYGVTLNKSGQASGYAWSAAGIWVDFTNSSFQVPGTELVEEVVTKDDLAKDYCKTTGKKLCVSVSPDPSKTTVGKKLGTADLSGGISTDDGVKVADGEDFYQINLQLKNADGSAINLSTLEKLEFVWKDGVKLNQFAGATGDYSNSNTSEAGGIVYKPLKYTSQVAFLNDFEAIAGAPGEYQLKTDKTIRSWAPTSEGNVSFTTSTSPPLAFLNETFINPIADMGTIHPNKLVLERIEVKLAGESQKVLFGNGAVDLSFKFKPYAEVHQLTANNGQDSLSAVRGVPEAVLASARKNSEVQGTANVELKVAFDKVATVADSLGACSSDDADKFVFQFYDEKAAADADVKYEETMGIGEKSIQLMAALTGQSKCSAISGATIYSEVTYTIGGKETKFYSNKLPRTGGEIASVAAVIKGNVFASKALSPKNANVQETGTREVNTVRNSLNENVERKIKASLNLNGLSKGGACTITGLNANGTVSVSGCSSSYYRVAKINDENFFYTDGNNVSLSLGTNAGKWVVIVENGRVFIDNDIYGNKIGLVSLRPYSAGCNVGNVYIKNDVRNIDANIFTDCSVISYVDKDRIDNSEDGNGLYQWGSFAEMSAALGTQLYLQGSIASNNTIGGGDAAFVDETIKILWTPYKVYTLPVPTEDLLKIQQYDFNFLRLFQLRLQTKDGLPIDQSCGLALKPEEIAAINKWKAGGQIGVPPVMGVDKYGDSRACNGINASLSFSKSDEGDLTTSGVSGQLAKDLASESYEPFYVDYSPAESFLFKK